MPLSAGDMLAAQLVACGGDGAALLASTMRPWASATFEGQLLRFEVRVPAERRATFAAGLAQAEFALRRHFVADLAITAERADALVLHALIIEEA